MVKVYSDLQSERSSYVFSFLFGYIRKDWAFVEDPMIADVVYSNEPIDTQVTRIVNQGIIEGDHFSFEPLYAQVTSVLEADQIDENLDVIAFIFHVLSRMEEYVVEERDEHDRFQYTSSLLYKHGMLERPVVDLLMQLYFGDLVRFEDTIRYTLDVDTAFFYLGKDKVKNTVYNLSDLARFNIKSFKERWRVRTGRQTDPYVQNIRDFADQKPLSPKNVFWLMSTGTEYDRQITFRYRYHKKLIIETQNQMPVSLHASYAAYMDHGMIAEEKAFLESIIEKEVTKSRFHYIRLRLPESYQNLIKANIKEDWTMGYPDTNGFRAGTTRRFRWYDLSRESQSSLLIVPFHTIDLVKDVDLESFRGEIIKVYHNFEQIKLD